MDKKITQKIGDKKYEHAKKNNISYFLKTMKE